MNLAILPDFKFMSAIRHEHSSFDTADESRKAFENAFDITINCDSKIVIPKQMIDKLKFSYGQQTAMEAFCEFDKTTVGVPKYNHEIAIVETANTWLIKCKVIVISDRSTKLDFKNHENLFMLTPNEFNNLYKEALEIQKKVPSSISLIQIIMLLILEHRYKHKK